MSTVLGANGRLAKFKEIHARGNQHACPTHVPNMLIIQEEKQHCVLFLM